MVVNQALLASNMRLDEKQPQMGFVHEASNVPLDRSNLSGLYEYMLTSRARNPS